MALHGVRLGATVEALTALSTLVDSAPETIVDARWIELTDPGHQGAVLASESLGVRAVARALSAGVEMVAVVIEDTVATVRALGRSHRDDTPTEEQWTNARVREASSLVEALRPTPLRGAPVVEEVIFAVQRHSPAAQKTLERLLRMGRDDVTVARVTGDDGEELLVRVKHPPLYLLLRADEEPDEGVRAYARERDTEVWVRWGYTHALSHVAHSKLGDRLALVDPDGRWRFVPLALPFGSLYDVLAPRFEAHRETLTNAPGELRFTVHLGLAASGSEEPELWLLDPDEFLSLEPLVESITPDDVGRFTVARTTGKDGTIYLLRELTRPGVPRLGQRVSDLTGSRGFVRAPGTEGLFVPVGRKLTPVIRRDVLRELLGLDRHFAVVIAEDTDGPRVVNIDLDPEDESPLTRWVDYVATDRRLELERLEEASVFAWPELDVLQPKPAPKAETTAPAKPPARPRREKPTPQKNPANTTATVSANEVTEESLVRAALLAEAREIELSLARGGVTDPSPWWRLAQLGKTLGDDDYAFCTEAWLFYSRRKTNETDTAVIDTVSSLASTRVKLCGRGATIESLTEIATETSPTSNDANALGARVLECSLRGDPGLDAGLLQQCVTRFCDPMFPVSRRLAWVVLRELLERTQDGLGLTRAKERLLGGVNDRGLGERYDLPRFVRRALATNSDGDQRDLAVQHAEQLTALEELWGIAAERYVRELDSLSAYVRVVFFEGFTRLGAVGRAREIIEPVENEASVHDAPNKILFRLYRARTAHRATQGDASSWKSEVDTVLGPVRATRTFDLVTFLLKRSAWLRTGDATPTVAQVRPSLDRELSLAEASGPTALARTLATIMDRVDGSYDYEVSNAIERTLSAALSSGDDDALLAVLDVASQRLRSRITIAGHRARAIGHCIRAAAILGDGARVEQFLDDVASLAKSSKQLAVREVLDAVRPALAALRRLGASESASRFLQSLVPMTASPSLGGAQLQATLAEGFLRVNDFARADAMLDSALAAALDQGALAHHERYDVGAAVLDSLKHWPLSTRVVRVKKILSELDRFTDAFTASLKGTYATHKVLILEGVIDTVADQMTWQGDRVQSWLDEEEQAIRRRVIEDWRDRCGP